MKHHPASLAAVLFLGGCGLLSGDSIIDVAEDRNAVAAYPWLAKAAENCRAYDATTNEIQKSAIYRRHLEDVKQGFAAKRGSIGHILTPHGGGSAKVKIRTFGLSFHVEVLEGWHSYDVLGRLEEGGCVEFFGSIVEPLVGTERQRVCGTAYQIRLGSIRPCNETGTTAAK